MVLKELLVLLVAIGACAADDCPEKYRRFSDEHIYCKPNNTQCQMVSKGVQEEDKVEIVRLHNEYRSKVATGKDDKIGLPSAANMLEMVWDEELAIMAQKHSESCSFQQECTECRRVPNGSVGQNIYMSGVSGSSEPSEVDWEPAVRYWYAEVEHFRKDHVDPFRVPDGPATGRFTQLAWATTWRVGCGRVAFKTGNRDFRDLYTCDYGPMGNVLSGSMYQAGKECSKCPQNSCCGSSCSNYTGLCKMQKDEAPRFPPPNDATFFCSFNGEKDCAYQVTEGAKKWQTQNTLSGNFLTAVLEGGESSKVTFDREISAKEKMCLSLTFSKGPHLFGEKCDHETVVVLQVGTFEVETKMATCNVRDMPLGVSIAWNMKTKVHFTFSVPVGAPRQFFQLWKIEGREGLC